ncbi:MAG: DUF4097 family beta strand repeat-containing protein [Actinomycetes bacterium]
MPIFSTPTPISASIEIAMGDIRVIASERTDTVVDVTPSNASTEADVRAAEQTRVEFADGRLRVVGPKRRVVGPSKKSGSIEVTLEVPTTSHLDAATSLGWVQSAGRLGECRIRTSAGDIRLQDASGVDLNTGIGAIEVDSASGAALCTTGSGPVRVAEIDGAAHVKNSNGDTWLGEVRGDLRVKAANGDISVDRARADVSAATANGTIRVGCVERGTVELKTAAGPIEVGIRTGTAARLELRTSFGDVRNHLDATDRPEPAETTVDVHAQTGYGDIVVRRAQTDES